MFFVLRHHFVPRHFPESRRKNPESRRKKGIWQNLAEFCSKHFSALNNMTRPYKNVSASAFFGPRHLFWESAEINAYRQVRHFLPRGVCRYCGIDLATSVCWTQQESKHRKQVFVGKVHVADVSSTICGVKISCYSLDEFGLMFS